MSKFLIGTKKKAEDRLNIKEMRKKKKQKERETEIRFRESNRKEREESFHRKLTQSEEKMILKRKLKDNVKNFSKMSEQIIFM